MDELNQYVLSQELGSRMKPVADPQFGNIGLLATTAEAIKARELFDSHRSPAGFTFAQDEVIVRAFEDVRAGCPPDQLLWDRDLSQRFSERCRTMGIDADDAALCRRLLNVRKDSKRYARHGIRLSPSAKDLPTPEVPAGALLLIEFALVRIRYRFGAAIDEMLVNASLSEEFERLVHTVAPDLRSDQARFGALQLRKSRFIKRSEREKLRQLDVESIERGLGRPKPLRQIRISRIPDGPGLVEISEEKRCLYVSSNQNLRATLRSIVSGDSFKIVAGAFWQPRLDDIVVQYLEGSEFQGESTDRWARRLVAERHPLLNWPVERQAA